MISRYCPHCGKAKKACICQWITPVSNDIPVIVLQHPDEVSQPLGTARILNLSLEHCYLLVGEDFSQNEELEALLEKPEINWHLLYPADHATPAGELHITEGRKTGLILLDGTWRKAYKMFQLSTSLHPLPCISLGGIAPSNYRIRKSPKAEGLSTVEAACLALGELSGKPQDYYPMLETFNKMIDFQINQMPPGVYERHYGKSDN
ncbi:DTW domain-containing protein [Parasalinivibrio latis]|uniref:tRNA-uridine aminocarboxypropyltransferase n=1 Tax=Parasalinivibrio latis TaxID=2952610 RepID=UPI0030E36C0B